MNIGQMDRRIQIQSVTEAQSASGFPAPTWATTYTVWAKVEATSGTEKREGDQEVWSEQKNFTIRYITGITAKMRILYNSEYYDIIQISEQGRDKTLILSGIKRDNA